MLELLLAAMIVVESGGDCSAVGKAGERGPLQISRAYWGCGVKQLKAEKQFAPDYDKDAHNLHWSKVIARAYFRRYEPSHYPPKTMADCEVLAKLHRKGWNWRAKKNAKAVAKYWKLVKAEMEREK